MHDSYTGAITSLEISDDATWVYNTFMITARIMLSRTTIIVIFTGICTRADLMVIYFRM